ncbi:MAG: beta-ketoacyl-[acyl-carrier-protein] synthase family protein [Thermodesulfobacteriota bacterium]|nr:beta-ketoacyl-[acyl-carrier-protein] synthase family protein [Thermodesulfobacteriota bacterium]
MGKRAVITGIGVISSLGGNKNTYEEALRKGISGVGPITLFDAASFPTRIAAEVKDFKMANIESPFNFNKDELAPDRRVLFAHAATYQAVTDAGFDFKEIAEGRCGIIMGAGIHPIISRKENIMLENLIYNIIQLNDYNSEQITLEVSKKILDRKEDSPIWVPADYGTVSIAQVLKLRGLCLTITSACAASSQAVGLAYRKISRGEESIIITGGYDSMIFPFGVGGFCMLGIMSTENEHPEKAVKPFDRKRTGLVLGEGAGSIILEEFSHAKKRGARIYGEIIGFGNSQDAYSVSAPHPEGKGAIMAMEKAIQDAKIITEDIDYINAHGTATLKNDRIETEAIKSVFGEYAYNIPISSTKSMLGHTISAAGILELIATILGINGGFAPPTINYKNRDPACDLDYVPNVAREMRIKRALSNSFGFGGQNSCIVIENFN